MKKVFNPSIYPLPVLSDQCFGCGSNGESRTRDLAAYAQFINMTGHAWHDVRLMSYPLRKDCHSLGIESADVPVRIDLCLRCAVEYMTTFNALLQEAKQKRRPI